MRAHGGRWWRVLVLMAALSAGSMWWQSMRRHRAEPAPPAIEARSSLLGIANWMEKLSTVAGGTLSVQLLDVSAAEPAGTLMASTQVVAPRGATYAGWKLDVPTQALPRLERSVLVVTLVEQGAVRLVVSGPLTQYQYAISRMAARSPLDPVAVYLRPPNLAQALPQ